MNVVTGRLTVMWFLAVAVTIGCSSETPPVSVAPSALPDVQASSDSPSDVTADEAEAFANEWEELVRAGDTARGQQLFLFDRIIERTISNLSLDAATATGVRQGLRQSQPMVGLLNMLHQAETNGGHYRAVRTAVRGGHQHVVFRLVDASGALNYHDLRLVRDGGTVRADQLFVAATGEELADTMTNAMAPAAQSQQSIVGRLDGTAAKRTADLKHQAEMMNQIRAGQKQQALQTYEKISEEGRKSKITQLGRVMATSVEDEKQYLTVLDEYAARFPNDPSLALISLDASYLRKDAERLRSSYDAVQKWTGGDDYLTLMVSSLLAQIGEPQQATELYKSVDVSTIELAQMHDFGLSLSLELQNHDATLLHLRLLRDQFGYQFDDLSAAEGFENFAKSEQFKQWANEI